MGRKSQFFVCDMVKPPFQRRTLVRVAPPLVDGTHVKEKAVGFPGWQFRVVACEVFYNSRSLSLFVFNSVVVAANVSANPKFAEGDMQRRIGQTSTY